MDKMKLTQAARNWMEWVTLNGGKPMLELDKEIHDLSRIGERGMVIEEARLDEHSDVDLHDLTTYYRLQGYRANLIEIDDVTKLVISWV